MIGLIALLGAALIGVLISMANIRKPEQDADRITAESLGQARDALVSYAAARSESNRAGELPCPDTTGEGNADTCPTPTSPFTAIGRLPWKTLRIPDLRDGSGEQLWYAVSSAYTSGYAPPGTGRIPLNVDTPGSFTVNGTNVIAVVFAPGQPQSNQTRNSGADLANFTNYLEGENANGDLVFAPSPYTGPGNDRLIVLTHDVLFPPVQRRVANVAKTRLEDFLNDNTRERLPRAIGYTGSCVSNVGGRIPPEGNSCMLKQDGSGLSTWNVPSTGYTWPAWFWDNQWDQILYYSVSPRCTQDNDYCGSSGSYLNVDGASGIRALIIMPGPAMTGQVRPCAAVTDCLEGTQNTDAGYYFETPTTGSNDKLLIVSP